MVQIPLSAIVLDATTRCRCTVDAATVADYAARMAEGDTFPPIVIFREGDKLHVADGFHRIAAAEQNGFADIEAEVRKGSRLDAIWFALGANRQHGQRLSAADREHAVKLALHEFPDKSLREIAGRIGCSHEYVRKIKDEVSLVSTVDTCAKVMGKDGKSYPSKQERKPKATSTAGASWTAPDVSGGGDEPVPPPSTPPATAPDAGEQDAEPVPAAKPSPTTKPETLRSLWMKSTKAAREGFLLWVDSERTKDMPKGDRRDIYRMIARLRRMLKKWPSETNYVRGSLGLDQ